MFAKTMLHPNFLLDTQSRIDKEIGEKHILGIHFGVIMRKKNYS